MKQEENIKFKVLPHNLPESIIEDMNSLKFSMSDDMWHKLDMDNVCQKIQQWGSSQIILNRNMAPQIIKTIKPIKFSQLVYLSLIDNQIQSVEAFWRLNCQSLEELFLINNHITKIHDFCKGYFKDLFRLAIHENKITDADCLGQSCFRTKYLSFEMASGNREQCSDLRWLVKLSNLERVWKNERFGVGDKQFKACIKRKFSQVYL